MAQVTCLRRVARGYGGGVAVTVGARTARHASRSRDSSSACDCTDGPVAMVGTDRHGRTCSGAEAVARTAPVAMACADRHSRTCSEAEVVAWTALSSWPAQTATVAHAAGRRWSHARPCSHSLGLRDGRRLGVARSAGHQRSLGLSCGTQLRSRKRHCYAAASVSPHLQPHSRPSCLRYHIAAAPGHSAVRRLPGARIYDIAGLRAHGGELHIYPARTYSQSVSYPTGERTGHVFRVHR